jgi:RNA polymerase sigma factor (sigma-70 family)
MATSKVIHHLRRAALLSEGAPLTDAQLVACFVERRDEAAIAALVRRHGPMVLGVCQRLLRNHHDAEDAFQATFLVFVRKAASISSRDAVANWLYGVAYNVAQKARALSVRRGAREKQVTDMPEPEAAPRERDGENLRALLDQEVSRLPDKYRAPVVLCDLQGKTRNEAASQLGLREGTVSSRLSRARTMLAKRLARRGLALTAGSVAALLGAEAAPAAVPASLAAATVKAAGLFAAGPAAGAIPVPVAILAEGVMKMMSLSKLKTGLVILLVAIAAGVGGAALIAQTPPAGGSDQKAAAPPKEAAKDADRAQKEAQEKHQKAVKEELEKLQGTWVLTAVEVAGEKPWEQDVTTDARCLLTITGNKSVQGQVSAKEKSERFIRIDPTAKPKAIDWAKTDEFKEGEVFYGIYELDGDTLKLLGGGTKPADRPTEMKPKAAREGKGVRQQEAISHWKRVKP